MKKASSAKNKKQQIINAAIELIAERGYHKTTTALIAKTADVSQGLIFHYFGDKEKLYLSILESASRAFREEIEKNTYAEKNVLKQIEMVALTYCRFVENHEDIYAVLRQYHGSGPERRKRSVSKLIKVESVKLFKEILKEGIKQGVIRRIDSDMMVSSFFGMMEFNVFRWIITQKSFPLEKALKDSAGVFIRGIKQ